MANPTSAAGDNGVSGAISGVSGGTTAMRNSVAKTANGYGSAVPASGVYSETKNLRFTYHPVECDSPARVRS